MLEKIDMIPSKLIKVAESSVHMQILANDSQSVIDIFEKLYWELNPENFIKLFRLCLTDNGSEFSNPLAIEFDKAEIVELNFFIVLLYYGRKKIGDLTPYELFRTFYGEDILGKLGATLIPSNNIVLRPDLLIFFIL